MKVGFTGTRKGMSNRQLQIVELLLCNFNVSDGYHGGCIGADEQFHKLCNEKLIPPTIYPSNISQTYGDCPNYYHRHQPMKPLERNRRIVSESNIIIATPREDKEVLRSGTWSTIRYARKARKHIIIVYPNGEIIMEKWSKNESLGHTSRTVM